MSIGESFLSSTDVPRNGWAGSADGRKAPSTGNNLFTVDVEDWRQSTLDHHLPINGCAVDNTRRFLDITNGAAARVVSTEKRPYVLDARRYRGNHAGWFLTISWRG